MQRPSRPFCFQHQKRLTRVHERLQGCGAGNQSPLPHDQLAPRGGNSRRINAQAPLAGGFLSGKYLPETAVPADSRIPNFGRLGVVNMIRQPFLPSLRRCKPLPPKKEPATLRLRWRGSLGPRTLAQLEDALGAIDLSLSADELARLDEVAPPGRAIVSYYGEDGEEVWEG